MTKLNPESQKNFRGLTYWAYWAYETYGSYVPYVPY